MKTIIREPELKKWKEEGTLEAIRRFRALSPIQKIKKTQRWLEDAKRLLRFRDV